MYQGSFVQIGNTPDMQSISGNSKQYNIRWQSGGTVQKCQVQV